MNPATPPCVGTRPQPWRSCGRAPRIGCSDFGISRLVCRVLAPPEAPGKRPRNVDVSSPSQAAVQSGDFWSSTTSFASQLLSHFRVPAFAAASPDAVLREASSKERELQSAKGLVDVSAFLTPVGAWELKYIRTLSALTALTYYMHLVTPRRLQRLYGMQLVTTSRACDIRPYEHNKTAEEWGADGDGMAVSVQDVRQVYQSLKLETAAGSAAAGLNAVGTPGSSNIVALPREVPYQVVSAPQAAKLASAAADQLASGAASGAGPSGPQPSSAPTAPPPPQQPTGGAASGPGLPRMLRSPAEVVASKLAEAALAASAAASASPWVSAAAEGLYAGLASLPIGGALVGANNKASNALLSSTSTSASLQASVDAGSGGGAGAEAADAAGGVLGSRKATAAGIAAIASDRFRQQSLRGLAAVNASGMLTAAASSPSYGSTTASTNGAAAGAGAGVAANPNGGSSLVFSTTPQSACPSEWFVVDDDSTNTRVFVIQGSDTLDHWKLNLTFDPVVFEDPSLGVKVHRGVYEAALALYDRFLPLVYEHIESSPFAKVAFTGHSIGGSLATLLMIVYRHRGVLPPHNIAPVYTFGAPAVFCQKHHSASRGSGSAHGSGHNHSQHPGEGHSGRGEPGHQQQRLAAAAAATANSSPSPSFGASLWSLGSGGSMFSASSVSSMEDPPTAAAGPASESVSPGAMARGDGAGPCGCGCGADGLLTRLQLPPHIVRNIVMARDIVPRAFACDYSPVADILRSWGSSFKEHCCLNRNGRKHLYYFVGRMCILQPDRWHSFVGNDPEHPMLPSGPELYYLTDAQLAPPPPAAPAPPEAAAAAATKPAAARNVTEAVSELMDCPHPLEMLADPGSYMATGSISRYHNPENYTKALGRIKHLKRLEERRRQPASWDVGSSGSGDVGDDEAALLSWDSSDGLGVASAHLSAAGAHACR